MKEGYTHDRISRELKEADFYTLIAILLYTGAFALIFCI